MQLGCRFLLSPASLHVSENAMHLLDEGNATGMTPWRQLSPAPQPSVNYTQHNICV